MQNIVDPEAWVVEHAVDIGFDFTITPQGLAQLGGADTC
jgi:hypothetical protein